MEHKVVSKGVLGLIAILLLCAACAPLAFFGAGTAAGVGGYKYIKGALVVLYEAPYIQTWDASLRALEEMGLKIEKAEHDLTTGEIKARRADGKQVILSFEYKSARTTQVKIRVGIFGDEDASMVIKEKIRDVLVRS